MEQIEEFDEEWATDWGLVVAIYEQIEKLRSSFDKLDVPYLRQVQQKVLLLNLEKYAWTLQNYIIEKYSKS